jgi:hypothetical protein
MSSGSPKPLTLRSQQARSSLAHIVCGAGSAHTSAREGFGVTIWMLDLAAVDLAEITTALQDRDNYERRWLVHSKTGEIVFWTEDGGVDGKNPVDLDDLDPDLVAVRPLPSYVWYEDMANFAEQISDEQAGRRLTRAIRGRGAFRHFKNELHEEYPHLVAVWYAFRDARAKRRAVEWLVDNDLVSDTDAERFLADHPVPAPP